MTHQRDEPDIATPEEVLATLTDLMRGDKPSEKIKAAEHLAKHYGILTPTEEKADVKPEIVEEIDAALRAMEAQHGPDGP